MKAKIYESQTNESKTWMPVTSTGVTVPYKLHRSPQLAQASAGVLDLSARRN
jgi:hypothetical protein